MRALLGALISAGATFAKADTVVNLFVIFLVSSILIAWFLFLLLRIFTAQEKDGLSQIGAR